MALYQSSVLKKYLKLQEKEILKKAYKKYTKYFLNLTIQENIKNSKEEEYQGVFLTELFVHILGYELSPKPNFNLVAEYKNQTNSRKADGAILKEGIALGVIELKGTKTKDLESIRRQAFDYKANQKGCVYVITSNFEKLRFYINDATEFVEFNLFTLTESEFNLMYLCLHKESIFSNTPLKIKEESVTVEEKITKSFYADYSIFKRELYRNLVKRNAKQLKNNDVTSSTVERPQEELVEQQRLEKNVKQTLFKKSQKLIDRFLFIFFAEDRGLLPPNSTIKILDDWNKLKELDAVVPLYNRFKLYFNYLDIGRKGTGKKVEIYAYNGGLFKPDSILDAVEIDDELLAKHTRKLANYDFESQVDVNILGHIFENSLNEIESVNAEIEGGNFDKQKSKRKKDGVFYTPKYITKYIVENTVGKLCEEKKQTLGFKEEEYFKSRKNRPKAKLAELVQLLDTYRDWLLQLTICDPACGSGAFLNQALDFLIKEHTYIGELKTNVLGGGLPFPNIETTILENNIFGVDLNEESVEIAKLSLWLRTAQPRRKLNDLSSNIKCGNSLIDSKAVAGDKAFNWQEQFPTIFKKQHKKAVHITTAIHDSRTSARMVKYKVREKREMGTNPYSNVIYFTEKDDLLITQTIATIVKEEQLNMLAYNICADHIHLLLVCDIDEVPSIMQKIKGKTSYVFTRGLNPLQNSENKNTKNPLWQQKYSPPKEITSQEQLNNTINYIQNNRSKHKLPAHSNEINTLINTMCCDTNTAFNDQYKGGFDVVIGNPPYVQVDDIIYKKYETQKCSDLYAYFFEKGVITLKNTGILGFITPSSYFTNIGYASLRNYLLNYDINAIVDLGENVFASASVDSGITILSSKKSKESKIQVSDSSFNFSILNKSHFRKLEENMFNIYTKPAHLDLANKIETGLIFENFINFSRGVEFGFKSKNVIEEQLENYFPIVCGSNISRNLIYFENKYVNHDDNNLKIYKSKSIYEDEKILVRRIGNAIISCYDDNKFHNVCDVYNLQVKEEFTTDFSLKFISVILNSSLINFYFETKFKSIKKLFPKIPIKYLKLLPIKKISLSAQQPFIEKANQILLLNKKLQEISSKFQRTLKREFEQIDKLSKKLQTWYELNYVDFLKELKKKKVVLSLSQKSEWEDYFLAEQQKAVALKTQIDKTDAQIDAMVYELYELTEEEIAIVESS